MLRLLLRRAGHGILIVWLVATATFFLLHLAPGDPIAASLDSPLTPPAVRAHYRHVYGLDQPLSVQYGHWLVMMTHGDFGFSFPHRRPVSAVIASALPNTLLLMGVALVLAFAAGIALGLIQARHRGRPLDWGLGHATRCIPIIRELIAQGAEPMLAGEAAQEQLLKAEFPALPFLYLPGYRIRYAKTRRGLAWKMIRQGPKIQKAIRYLMDPN